MYGHLAQPEENMFGRCELGQLAVQLEEDVLRDLFGGRAVCHNPQGDAENHRLVLEHQPVKCFRGPDQMSPVSLRSTGLGKVAIDDYLGERAIGYRFKARSLPFTYLYVAPRPSECKSYRASLRRLLRAT